MTRQEQIKEMAKFHAKCMTSDKDLQVAFADALRRGAQWSDEHPDINVRTMAAWRGGYKEAIDKACEWLDANVCRYASLEFPPESDYAQGSVEVESLLKAFKQAMKGEEK